LRHALLALELSMKRMTASILAASLAVTAAPASAQVTQFQPYPDSRGYSSAPQYDYARVVRVDPVFGSSYGRSDVGTRCYERPTYVGGDRYDPYDRGHYGRDDYARGGYGRDGYYDRGGYDPYGERRGGTQAGATVATVVGGIVGAVIGSQVGGGSARYATSAIGSMVGGIAGRGIYDQAQRQRDRTGTVRVCDPVPADGRYTATGGSAVTAYDVTYEYGGRQYTTRTDHHPGDRIRVHVDVRPD
jgi:hypothetical protein